MKPIEALTRLNPSTCRFDIGAGGLPELANIDMAAALALTHDQIGAALLQMVVNGWSVPGALQTTLNLTRALVLQEADRRQDIETTAEIQGLTGIEDSRAIRDLRAFDRERWPQDKQRVDRLIAVAVHELIAPNVCWTCGGKGPQTRLGHQLMSIRRLRRGMTAAEIVDAAMPRRAMDQRTYDRTLSKLSKAVNLHLSTMAASGVMSSRSVVADDGTKRTIWKPLCRHCHGTGRRELSEQKIADYLGLSMSGWRSAQTSHHFLRWLRGELAEHLLTARRRWAWALT